MIDKRHSRLLTHAGNAPSQPGLARCESVISGPDPLGALGIS
jgi:hypothetical protein